MAITYNIRYTGKENSVSFFLQEMKDSGTVDAIRAEKGNIRYEYYWSLDDPQTVLLIDSWESQADLDAHHESPMMKTIISLREKYDIRMTVERYIRAEDIPSDYVYIRK
ncbi:MAG: antibiotic biosynthesis monooxygenase [Mogibacterium sp.]|nr:antibiotic biosynthesis monooxygenase [Mogibacterium sp.]